MDEEIHRLVRWGDSVAVLKELHQSDCLYRHPRPGVSAHHPADAVVRDLVEIAADGPEGLRIVRCSGFEMDY